MANKIDPLLRGIYYLYLSDGFLESIDDVSATFELTKIWHHAQDRKNWTSSLNCMYADRKIFVKELVRRYEH